LRWLTLQHIAQQMLLYFLPVSVVLVGLTNVILFLTLIASVCTL